MALERIAGPLTLTNGLTGAPWTPYTGGIYVPGVGLLLPVAGPGNVYCVQIDGTAYPIGAANYGNYGLVGDGSRQDYAFAEQSGGEWNLDPITLMKAPGQINANDPRRSGFVRLPDRYIAPYGQNIVTCADGAFNPYMIEATMSGASFSWSSWSGDPAIIVVSGPTGLIGCYHWQTKQFEPRTSRIADSSLVGLYYARDLDVYLSLKNVNVGGNIQCQLSVWSPRPRPASITTPAASPAVKAGRRSTLSVTVTGSFNEPCAGETVAWGLTGPGNLVVAATATDANGIASTYYDAPLDATGSATFTATVGL